MAKKKFYVVWEGRKRGIYTTWKECQEQIEGIKGARYKSFKTKENAEKAFKGNYEDYIGKTVFETELTKEQLKAIGNPILNSIAVDGACNNKGVSEYKGVYTDTETQLFIQGPYKGGSNNIVEFLALVHALAYCKKHKLTLPIYSDSRIAINWVQKKYFNTSIKRTKDNKKVFELMDRALNWLKINKYNNKILKWETKAWGEIPADFGRK